MNKNLIHPIGSSPKNHKWDQSLLTVLVYKFGKYPYTPKIKKIFGIKVNQNPGRYFYLVEGLKDSTAEEIFSFLLPVKLNSFTINSSLKLTAI